MSAHRNSARFWRDNALSLCLLGLFALFMAGQVFTGLSNHNEERLQHGAAAVALSTYLQSGDFWEVTAENWESEFLQMAAYVLLTIALFQRGSSESKDPDKPSDVDRDPRLAEADESSPWPVRRGGWILTLYEHSLSLAFLMLFIISMGLHALGGAAAYNEEQLAHGGAPVSTLEYLGTSRFWFESFQNWQSEFLALFAMVVLSVFLRQRGSPESKPVDAPHGQTGSE